MLRAAEMGSEGGSLGSVGLEDVGWGSSALERDGGQWLQVWLPRPKCWVPPPTPPQWGCGQRKRKKQDEVNAETGEEVARGLSSYTPWGPIKYEVTALFFF